MSRPIAVVTGAVGQLGSVMCRSLPGYEVVAITRQDVDVSEPRQVREFVARVRPSLIVNCAAYNDVDGAEDDAASALAVNAFALRSLARAADDVGSTLVHYGTDFVFSGDQTARPYRESDAPSPRSVYASSKLLGEWFALEASRSYVLRVESLFGCAREWAGRLGTIDTLVARMAAGEKIRVFNDRVVTPSRIDDVAAATRHLVETQAPPGLYHCVNSGSATWLEVAEFSARVLGLTPQLDPIKTSEGALRASRPVYCALDNSKLAAAGFTMPSWSAAVEDWLRNHGIPVA